MRARGADIHRQGRRDHGCEQRNRPRLGTGLRRGRLSAGARRQTDARPRADRRALPIARRGRPCRHDRRDRGRGPRAPARPGVGALGPHRCLGQQRRHDVLRPPGRGRLRGASAGHRYQPHRTHDCCPACLSGLPRQGVGTFINIGSVLSQVGQPFVPAYVISKFGLRGLSEALRTDVADSPACRCAPSFPSRWIRPTSRTRQRRRAAGPGHAARAGAGSAWPRHRRHRRSARGASAMCRAMSSPASRALAGPRQPERLLRQALETFHLGGQRSGHSRAICFRPAESAGSVYGERRPVVGRTLFAWWARASSPR